jgi:hypothetical protein
MFKSLCFYSETEAGVSIKFILPCPLHSNDIYASYFQFTLIIDQHNLKGNPERHFAVSIKQMAVVNSVSRRRWKAIRHKHNWGLPACWNWQSCGITNRSNAMSGNN